MKLWHLIIAFIIGVLACSPSYASAISQIYADCHGVPDFAPCIVSHEHSYITQRLIAGDMSHLTDNLSSMAGYAVLVTAAFGALAYTIRWVYTYFHA